MSNNEIITILLFLSIIIIIYIALLRWASRINDIEENLEKINAKLDLITETILKSQGQETGIKIDDHSNDKELH